MPTKLLTAVFLSLALLATAACSSSSQKQAVDEAQQETEDERAARQEAEQEAEDERAARLEAEREAEEAEQKAEDERAARQEAERRAEEEKVAREAAEAERNRLRQEAEEEQREADQAQAKAAFDALGGAAADGTRTDAGDVTAVTPRYGQTAMVTTSPAVNFESSRRSTSGSWSVTTFSNNGSTHIDDLVVYSDIGGPTQVLFTEHATYSVLFSAVTDTNNISASLSGATHPIASSRFPGGGGSTTFDHTVDSDPTTDGSDGDGILTNDYDTTRFGGSFAGVSGTFECTGTCTVIHRGGSTYDLSAGTWTFTTSKTARAPVPDDSYMYFGWWKRELKSDNSLSFEMFSGGMHEVDDIPDALVGMASYAGPVVGQYAIYQPLGTQTGGSFTARAQLTADFGTSGAEGTLSGRVTNFSNASDWSVALKSAAISGGAVTDGAVSWTIGGDTEDGGTWDAKFFSDVDGSTAYPQGVAGTFDARYSNAGRLIGAFGAHCPTSTCPRN